MKVKSTIGIAILLLFLFASCVSQSSITQTPTIVTKAIPTNSPNATATINSTPTPHATFNPTQALQATEGYFRFTAVPATIEARGAKCKDGFILERGLEVLDYSTDKWTLFTCSPVAVNRKDMWTHGAVNFGERYTQIVKTDLSTTWTIEHNTFDYTIIDRPDAMLAPYHWTDDGNYVYLSPRYSPGPGGGPEFFFIRAFINDLFRINLETGEFELFLKKDEFGDLAFSPNDQFLVYSEQSRPNVIHTINIETNEESELKIQEGIVAIGAFIWFPDSTKVVVFAGYGEDKDRLSDTAIFILTPKNMQIQKILAKDSRIFGHYFQCSGINNVWLDYNTICLDSYNRELDSWNDIFSFNIRTGDVEYLRPFP
ncbi:MAG TPA: hypothetical protein PLX90_06365 [Anaerolineales bacterium]|nr:hypothetical protein [Anaerolineales bacterium]